MRISGGARRALVTTLAALAALVAMSGSAGAQTLQYTLTGGARAIPSSFLGLSTEYNALGAYEAVAPAFERAVKLMEPENGSPLVLRIGGKSADQVYWEPPKGTKIPGGDFPIGASWMTGLQAVSAATGARVILDLNLAVHSTQMETAFAQAARKALGSDLVGLEIGNEPDLYHNQPYLAEERVAGTRASKTWPDHYSPSEYRSDYSSYASALRRLMPSVPLGGPDTISGSIPWLQSLIGLGSDGPNFMTIHRYAGSACWPPTSKYHPTIAQLLSSGSTTGLANTAEGAVQFAHEHGLQLRIDEVNSISCGGTLGISNTFVTSLWAPGALLSFADVGVNSVNLHIRPPAYNTPIGVVAETVNGQSTPVLRANPELYGLAMFAELTEPGAEIENGKLSDPNDTSLQVWPVHEFDGMRCALINRASVAQTVQLDLGNFNSAYLKRLLAPHVNSTSDITFGGQTIGSDGRWHGTLRLAKVAGHDGEWTVTLPAYSAALLNLYR